MNIQYVVAVIITVMQALQSIGGVIPVKFKPDDKKNGGNDPLYGCITNYSLNWKQRHPLSALFGSGHLSH